MGSARRCLLLLILTQLVFVVMGNLVFDVRHKYGGRGKGMAALGALRAHDSRRHGRMLAAVDFQLHGDYLPTSVGMYYTKITIGTPPVEYHVQVDTGSDSLWVNCHKCERCLTTSDLRIELKQYDLTASSTGKMITCDQDFCDAVPSSANATCQAGMNCQYDISYVDGSRTEGYFVRDDFRFDQVTGDLQTSSMNGSIAFGCSAKKSGKLNTSSDAVDGIIGFGQANSSLLSQLASTGKVKKVFSHCLDGSKGGGIFAIGEVVQPKLNRTPLVPNQQHYYVNLTSIEVGGQLLNLTRGFFETQSGGTIIDSGSTLGYLPSEVYRQLLDRMKAKHPDLQTHTVQQDFKCFEYSGNVNDKFPVVKFHFDGSLVLAVNPSSYLFKYKGDYCIGWQITNKTADGKEITLLGDIVLSDKLVLYDLENQTIGWTDYNCSSSIRVRDEATGNVYTVASRDVSSALSLSKANLIAFLLFIAALCKLVG